MVKIATGFTPPLLLPIIATACGLFGPSDSSTATLFIAAVGDTLHGLNRSYQFEVLALDSDGTASPVADVAWATSDPAVATVDQFGVLVTKSVGATTVMATVQDMTAEADVLVDDRAAAVAAGSLFVCALDQAGTAHCWGDNFTGELGRGSAEIRSAIPLPVAGDLSFHSLSAGWGSHVCGLTTNGEAYCWGGNHNGALGDGTIDIPRRTPVPVAGGIKFKYLRTGRLHTCGIGFDDKTYCWGLNSSGEVGAETLETCEEGPCTSVPVQVSTDVTLTSLQLGQGYTCGVAADGGLHCWGDLYAMVETDVRFRYVRGAHGWHCGMGTDDRVYCWSTDGQDLAPWPTPTLVPEQPQFTLLGEGNGGHLCGLDAEGIAYCWGSSSSGGLGLGPDLWHTKIPLPVDPELHFYAISSGDFATCAITVDFAVYCWGGNTAGELGTGNFDGDPDCPAGEGWICRTRPVRTLFDPTT